jgi:hypothetical protein
MKYAKILIFTLIVAAFLFPEKIFGLVASPDKYIHSMPFGVQQNTADIQDISTPSALNQANNEDAGSNQLQEPVSQNVNENNLNTKRPGSSLSINLHWLIFLGVLLVVIFLLIKIIRAKD